MTDLVGGVEPERQECCHCGHEVFGSPNCRVYGCPCVDVHAARSNVPDVTKAATFASSGPADCTPCSVGNHSSCQAARLPCGCNCNPLIAALVADFVSPPSHKRDGSGPPTDWIKDAGWLSEIRRAARADDDVAFEALVRRFASVAVPAGFGERLAQAIEGLRVPGNLPMAQAWDMRERAAALVREQFTQLAGHDRNKT